MLLAVLATLLWSGNFVIARGLQGRMPPVSLAFWRWLLATLLLLPMAWKALRSDAALIFRHKLHFFGAALTGITLFNTFIYIAGREVPAIHLALIGTTAAPVFVLLLSYLLFRERLPLPAYLGALLCCVGLLVLLTRGNLAAVGQLRLSGGDLWILAAALAFAVYTLLVRRRPPGIGATSYLFVNVALGTVLLLPAYLWERSQMAAGPLWDAPAIFSVAYLALCASAAAFLLWNEAIRRLGPARTSLFGNLIPVFSTLEAAAWLGERITPTLLAAFAFILCGLLLAQWQPARKREA
ncbi:DMT family transporter [Flaviaesturariibacter amylovorans]|uniref:DMT family transporter n=2 Tax=Flaviaesturariibacter amylovorans TaxID=1084520 RepID=A0ABP8GEB1_9BACT